MAKERPCDICLHSFEEHAPWKELEEPHIFCPDQDLREGPVEAFYCYVPCGNLAYLEYLSDKKGTTING
jgi:hypothetical protein